MSDPYQDHPNVSPGIDSVWGSAGGQTLWIPQTTLNGGSQPSLPGEIDKYRIDVSKAVFSPGKTLLTIPTGLAGNDIVEPSLVHVPGGYFGHKLWMAAAPYLNSDDQYENPSLWVSDDDGLTWTVPSGVTNPVYPANVGGAGWAHNSDPMLFLNPSDQKLYMFWNQFGPGTTFTVRGGVSADGGVTWSAPVTLLTGPAASYNPMTPSVLYDAALGLYVMYCVDGKASPRKIIRFTASSPLGTWTQSADPTYPAWPTSGYQPWHLNARIIGTTHVIMMVDAVDAGSGSGGIFLMASDDGGATFSLSPRLYPMGGYRSDFIPTFGPGGITLQTFWGRTVAGSWELWRGQIDMAISAPAYGVDTTDALTSYLARVTGAARGIAPFDFCDLGKSAPEFGSAWAVSAGTWGYTSGTYGPTVTGNARVTQTAASADGVVEAVLNYASGADTPWIMVRYLDSSNFIRIGFTASLLTVQTVIAGTVTSVTPQFSQVASGSVIKVVCSGSTISVYANGTLLHVDTITAQQTAVVWGLQANTTGCSFKNVTHRDLYNGA